MSDLVASYANCFNYNSKATHVKCSFIFKLYRKSGNFHVEIIHVVNIQCRFIFVGLLYPRKYFDMNLFQQKHLAITIVHVLLISRMNISL